MRIDDEGSEQQYAEGEKTQQKPLCVGSWVLTHFPQDGLARSEGVSPDAGLTPKVQPD